MGLGVALAAGLVAALPPLQVVWRDGTAAPAATRAVVLPFSYHGAGEASYLSEGLVFLFAAALDGENFRVADAQSVVRRTKENGREAYDVPAGADLAERFGARLFLLGNAVETAGRLWVTASLYERGQPEPVASATAEGTTADVLDLVDEVAATLLTSISGRSGSRVTRIASITTDSLPALKAYLRGERLFGEGRFSEAIQAFEDAVAADSMFALADYRTSVAASWAFRGDLATRAAARAVRHADRLPERERRLLAAHVAYREGQAETAADLFRQLAALYPEDPEIWYRLGETLFHLGPVRGWSPGEAREPFLRAAALEPARGDAYYHLTQIAAIERDTLGALKYATLALEGAPTGARAPQLRMIQGVLRGSERSGARLRRLAGADDFTVVSSIYNLAVYLRRPALARDVAALLVKDGRPADTRAFGRLILAELDFSLGRPAAAAGHLDALERLDPRSATEYRALLALAPGAALERRSMAALLRRFPATPAAGGFGGTQRWKPDERYAPMTALYARGMLAATLGRTDEVREVVEALGAATDSASAADLAVDFQLAAARPGLLAGDRQIPPPSFAAPAEVMILSPALSRPARRYVEGRRLEELGASREALRWYESLAAFSVHDLPWAIPALVDRARIHESLGEAEAAAALYRRFAELWSDAEDPEAAALALARAERLESTGR